MTPLPFSRGQMVREATLTKDDLAEVAKCRRDHNRLGFAYQVGFVRLFNRFPAQQPLEICDEVLHFVSLQVGVDEARIADYAPWQHTTSEHQKRIRDYLGLVVFDAGQAQALEQFVFEESCRLEQTASLFARAREFLKGRRVLFPAESVLLRLVGEQKKRAREHIVAKLAGALSPGVIEALDGLLEVKEGEAVSALQGIKANPAKPSATAMQGLADKLAAIEATGTLAVDLSWLNANYQRALFHYVRKCSADRLREAGRDRRLAALVCFLRQSYRDAVDQAVDRFDKLLTRTQTRAEHELDDQMRGQHQTIKAALAALRSVGAIILDDSVAAPALRPRLFAAVPRDALAAQLAGLDEWVTGTKSDSFHGLVRRFNHLRQFSPVLLRALEFLPDAGDGDLPCLEALRVLKEMNADLKRKLPEDAPTDFIPKRLLPLVVTDAKADRKAWECALLMKLQNDLRSGNLSVKHGKRFGRFEDYFLPKERWEPLRKSCFQRSNLPLDPKDVGDYLKKRLNTAYDLFLKTAPANTYATMEEDGWHLSKDAAEALDAAAQTRLGELRKWLTRQMRSIRLPDLLIEVDNDLRFTDHFVPPAQRGGRDAEGVCTLLAVVLAHGCNIGLHTMAQIAQGVTYKQLKRVSDWQMTEESQRAALAALVHAISRLDTTIHWGEGRTSASDGQRFAMPRKVLQQSRLATASGSPCPARSSSRPTAPGSATSPWSSIPSSPSKRSRGNLAFSACVGYTLAMKSTSEICPQCQVLSSKVATLEAELTRVREQLAAAKKNSATSSKPPSSDIVKPKPPETHEGQKRSIGGQPGHDKHAREPFPPEQVTAFVTHQLDACPCCGGSLRLNPTHPRVVQQVDIEGTPLTIEQHTCPEYWCDHCRKPCWAPLPLRIDRGGLVGPHLAVLIAFMKGGCHASYSTIRTFLRDCVGVTLARSTLADTINKVSAALDGPYDELLRMLPTEMVLNIDETGHKCNKELWWTWCLRADLYTLFKIDPHRSADVLMDLLGRDFEGTIGCDYFSAYRRYMRECDIRIQFCLAHLIRDVKFLTTLSDAATTAYGERLRRALKALFEVIHRRGELSAVAFERQLKAARDVVLNAGMRDVPTTRHAENMAERFRKHGAAFFTFVTTPEVEPTNNCAEQAIRFVVIDRHITQGTRSETGRRWSERIWTTIATCAGQGRSVYGFLKECVGNWFEGQPSPSLLPSATPA